MGKIRVGTQDALAQDIAWAASGSCQTQVDWGSWHLAGCLSGPRKGPGATRTPWRLKTKQVPQADQVSTASTRPLQSTEPGAPVVAEASQWGNLRCAQTLGQPRLTLYTCCLLTLGPNGTGLESRSKGVFQNAAPRAEGLAGRQSRPGRHGSHPRRQSQLTADDPAPLPEPSLSHPVLQEAALGGPQPGKRVSRGLPPISQG